MLGMVLSILVLAALSLLGGAVLLWRKGVRKQAALMALLALIAAINVAIWTVPTEDGNAPLDAAEQGVL